MLYKRLEDGTIVLASQVKETKEDVAEVIPVVGKPVASAKASFQDKPVLVTTEVSDGKI